MKPKTVLPVNDQTLPLVLKYKQKMYLIRSTSNGSLHMSKTDYNEHGTYFELDPNPAQVDLSPGAMAKFEKENE